MPSKIYIFLKIKIFSFFYVSGSNFESSKNFLHFRKWNIFTSCLKKSCFVFRTTLKVFHFFTFSFLLAFTSFCFHFFMFSFLQMFLMLLGFVHFTVFSLRVLRISESVLFTLHSFLFLLRLPCRSFHWGLKHRPEASVCLNHTVFCNYIISRELYLKYSKYAHKLLTVNNLINFKHFS